MTTPTAQDPRCPACAATVRAEARFCPSCGATLIVGKGPLPPLAANAEGKPPIAGKAATVPQAAPARSNRPLVIGLVAAAAVILLAAVAAIVVLSSGGGDDLDTADGDRATSQADETEANAGAGTASVNDDRPPATADTDPVPITATSRPTVTTSATDLAGFLADIDGLLARSATARDEIVDVIVAITSEVDGCQLSATEARRRIAAVLDDRWDLLDELAAMTLPPDPEASSVQDALVAALEVSIESNQHWLAWVDDLYVGYWADGAPGCAEGGPPHGADYVAAVELGNEASARKQAFVGLYNPLAQEHGLRTWLDTEI